METTLTAIEYLQQLPEPIKSEAIAEAGRQQLETRFVECNSPECAIAACFLWYKSVKGADYWRKVAMNLSLETLNVQIS